LYIGIIRQALWDYLEGRYTLQKNADFVTAACDIIGVQFESVIKFANFFSGKRCWKWKFEHNFRKFIGYSLYGM